MTAKWPKPIAALAALVDPRLEGAACAGRAPLFDAEVDGEADEDRTNRLTAAARICRGCGVRAACTTAATEHQAVGVWAGRLHEPPRFHSQKRATA